MDLFEPWRNQPPARHALESDSEDEVDIEDIHHDKTVQGSSSRSNTSAASIKPDLKYSNGESPKGLKLVVAVDEGGQLWAQGMTSKDTPEDAECFYDGRKVASMSWSNTPFTAIVFARSDLSYDGMHAVAGSILAHFAPTDLSIIGSYPAPRYLSSQTAAGGDSGIRYLTSAAQSEDFPLPQLEPPNMATGLSAALMSTAIESDIPAVMILLPSSSTTSGAFATTNGAPPNTIYDYGSGLPDADHAGASTVADPALKAVAAKLGWTAALGWQAGPAASGNHANPSKARRKQAGFARLIPVKPYAEKTIGEGSMYL